MILGTIQYPSRYGGLGAGVEAGLAYLAERDLSSLPLGRHVIDGDDVYLDVIELVTVSPDDAPFEAHRRYLDIYITVSGEEWFGHAIASKLREVEAYSAERDVALYNGEGIYLQAPRGHFVLFTPEDAHKPGVYFRRSGIVRRAILKVKI